jgi:RNA polymerase sigma factor (sigma-70 family)
VTSRNDAELLKAARQDPEAFRELYDRYAVWIRSWFLRHTGSEQASLDLTAETFAQAWHSARRFRDLADGSGAPWLFGIARNLLRQYHKHHRVESAARERLGLQAPVAADGYERVDDRNEAGALAPLVRHALRALPADQRRAFELRIVHELPYDAVAGRLGCTQNAARLRVSRALRAVTMQMRSAQT